MNEGQASGMCSAPTCRAQCPVDLERQQMPGQEQTWGAKYPFLMGRAYDMVTSC